MPMSLLASKAWTSPNVWTRAAHCSATFSATPSSLASEVPSCSAVFPGPGISKSQGGFNLNPKHAASDLGRNTTRSPTMSPQRAHANPSGSTFWSGEYRADAEKSDSSSPFVTLWLRPVATQAS